MTVETVTYISDFNSTYPAGADAKSEGDNHIRNIKAGVKATFPNITGVVSASHTELSTLVGAPTTRPSFLAYRDADLTEVGAVAFNVEVHDTGSAYNNTNGRFVPPVTGTYIFAFHGVTATAGGTVNCYFRKAGSEIARIYSGPIAGVYTAASATIIMRLTATTDYVDIYNDSTDGLDGSNTNAWSWFSGALLWQG